MKIAMDYDHTFTADKPIFAAIVRLLKQRGHDVRFCTYRFEQNASAYHNEDIEADAKDLDIPIVYCNYTQKREVWQADIWMDDMPELIPTMDSLKAIVMGEL